MTTNELVGVNGERIELNFKHLPGGRNCMTSSLWKLLNHSGHKYSEEMLMGIASGLGFIYWKMKQMRVPFVGGMNGGRFPTILGTAVDRLGGSWDVQKPKSAKRAHLQLKEVLQNDQPALVCADIGMLDYLSIGGDDHFGMHTILVWGIDEEKNEAYISDRYATPITIPLSKLQAARASDYHPFPAVNKMMTVSMPETSTPLSDIIPLAIRENTKVMLEPPIKNIGLSGFLKWSKELAKYPKFLPDPADLVQALTEHYVYIEVGGSGGALFRRMFSDYLNEASKIMKDSVLKKASKDYAKVSDVWSQLAIELLPDEFSSLAEIRKSLWENNVELERDGIKAFKNARERTSQIPKLAKQAQKEVSKFEQIVPRAQELILEIHDLESSALHELDLWARDH
ncbi:MAG: BtrH N-terminal domain-containing protein [Candidatus Thorarchaeota archaeon]